MIQDIREMGRPMDGGPAGYFIRKGSGSRMMIRFQHYSVILRLVALGLGQTKFIIF